tara:strand:- start:180 stop:464 length:285 start_codon:yes stop_codon:yes gene_type:complete
MPKMLITVKISKGFKTWTDMARSLEDEAGANGAKIIWAGTNPDESSVFVMMDVPDPEFMQTFGLRPDIKKAREDAGADVSSTTVITPIGDYWLG